MRELAAFPDIDQVFNLLSPAEAFTQPMSTAATVFSHREPVLGLTAPEQELLVAALDGATDAELSVALSPTLPAVKARWRTIFARFAGRLSDRDANAEKSEEAVRGPQKRHRVLAYLRQHPEELRPFRG